MAVVKPRADRCKESGGWDPGWRWVKEVADDLTAGYKSPSKETPRLANPMS